MKLQSYFQNMILSTYLICVYTHMCILNIWSCVHAHVID